MKIYAQSLALALLAVLTSVSLRHGFVAPDQSATACSVQSLNTEGTCSAAALTWTLTAIGSSPVPPPRMESELNIGSSPVPPPRVELNIGSSPVPPPRVESELNIGSSPVPPPRVESELAIGSSPVPPPRRVIQSTKHN